MAYTKKHLIEKLLEFKETHGRYPTRKDFTTQQISPGKGAFYRLFGSVEKAARQAELYKRGELLLEEKKDGRRANVPAHIGNYPEYRCRVCGSQVRNHDGNHSDLTELLMLRFGKLVEIENRGTFLEGVLYSLNAIFSPKRKALRDMLRKRGLLEKYDEMFGRGEESGRK